jgi:type IV secretory pathway component VirB8
VARLGIENYNRKIEEKIRIKEENERKIELQKEKKERKDKNLYRVYLIAGILAALSTIFINMYLSCSANDKKENVELKN